MKRQELEKLMRAKKINQLDVIIHENDKYATWCKLTAAALVDYQDKRLDRKIDLWGYLFWKDGKSYRVAFKGE